MKEVQASRRAAEGALIVCGMALGALIVAGLWLLQATGAGNRPPHGPAAYKAPGEARGSQVLGLAGEADRPVRPNGASEAAGSGESGWWLRQGEGGLYCACGPDGSRGAACPTAHEAPCGARFEEALGYGLIGSLAVLAALGAHRAWAWRKRRRRFPRPPVIW